jgi:ketopantoate reductase
MLRTAAWRKLFSNLAGNPLTALTDGRHGIDVPLNRAILALLRSLSA